LTNGGKYPIMTNTHPLVKSVITVPRGEEERSQLVKMQMG